MPVLTVTIPAVPVAQPRQRLRVVQMAGGSVAQNYTSSKHPVQQFKATVKLAVSQVYSGPPLTCPLRVDLSFVFPRPKRLRWSRREMPRVPHVVRPDRDNLDKAVLDALTGLLWANDCQVCGGAVEKWIASGDEQPHVELRVTW